MPDLLSACCCAVALKEARVLKVKVCQLLASHAAKKMLEKCKVVIHAWQPRLQANHPGRSAPTQQAVITEVQAIAGNSSLLLILCVAKQVFGR